MNVKAFTILFFALICFSVGICLVADAEEVDYRDLTFWSDKTAEFFSGPSKTVIDNNTYVVEYNLKEGWIKVHSEIPTLIAICDPFSGKWVKKFIKKGETNITLPFKPQPYAGLRLLTVSSPWGFAVLKEKEEIWSWWDYPIVILRSEMAKWSWERSAYALSLFIVGLALSRHVKKDRLIVNHVKHLIVIILVVVLLFAILSMRYTTDNVILVQNGTKIVKQIPHLAFDTYYVKEWYNYLFALCFIAGYVLGLWLWRYDHLYVAYASYNEPLRIRIYPYDIERGVIRDFDGKLTLIDFKNSFKQFINFELNGYNVSGILAVGEENYSYPEYQRPSIRTSYALAGFFGLLVICLIADYLNVFKIDLAYALLFAGLIAVLTNIEALKAWFGVYVEKIKVLRCSELMNEDNYTKMLKEAEIKHVIEDYEKLLRDYVKEKITMPRRTVKHLLSMIRQVKVTKLENKPKRREENGEDKD
ncbi:hypothetical protein [Archaeoglobus profundus]|uniref:Uncharacterized protein n=2 Tax=root TaxID=1 RepID=D2RFE0_ARCPA|nr:hypothetical protein [Archaeoglobus profundus]ADB58834.1 hypothetical protein Arcpr_1790 [Archaeoglobus profundus DSM 5631]